MNLLTLILLLLIIELFLFVYINFKRYFFIYYSISKWIRLVISNNFYANIARIITNTNCVEVINTITIRTIEIIMNRFLNFPFNINIKTKINIFFKKLYCSQFFYFHQIIFMHY